MTETSAAPGRSSAFDRATAVTPHGDGTTYDVVLDPAWTVGQRPNGGYLLAVMARAVARSVQVDGRDHPHPLSSNGVYLRAPETGPAEVVVEVLRTGRTASHARASLICGDRTCVEALFVLGRLTTDVAADYEGAAVVELPDEQECIPLPTVRPGSPAAAPIDAVSPLRIDPAGAGFASGRPSGRPDVRGWLRFADGRAFDPLSLLYAVDALPPATFELGSLGWVPTMELTAYVRAVPAPGPLRVRQWANVVADGLVDECCFAWDSRGRLVAQAVQLALVKMPGPV